MRHRSGFLYLFSLAIIGLSTNSCTNETGVDEAYKPDHPIEFPHDIHVSKGIDCKYCHNSANDGQNEGIPSANVCMKCHKQIKGNK
ncbi:cytochrome c3 family protein [Fluviicola taffensis]|uniref:cytochrome c3 family protein n=1 Tax=Fluviicola taffensis TaxID=191579 RepID=UPI0031383CD6